MHLHDFPEMRPGIFVCNTGWLSEGRIIRQKIVELDIKQLLMEPSILEWETCLEYIINKMNILVYRLKNREITPGSLILYDPYEPNSIAEFEREFNCKLGQYGKITMNEIK